MTTTAIDVLASIYMTGAHLCIRDDGELGFLVTPDQHDTIVRSGTFDAVGRHHDEIRLIVFEGIAQVLDGYQPALDGLDRVEATP